MNNCYTFLVVGNYNLFILTPYRVYYKSLTSDDKLIKVLDIFGEEQEISFGVSLRKNVCSFSDRTVIGYAFSENISAMAREFV
jgi:hypothetical protein